VSGPLWGARNAIAIVHNAKSITQRINEGMFVVGATDRRPYAVERWLDMSKYRYCKRTPCPARKFGYFVYVLCDCNQERNLERVSFATLKIVYDGRAAAPYYVAS
jgi:hypothetical protein